MRVQVSPNSKTYNPFAAVFMNCMETNIKCLYLKSYPEMLVKSSCCDISKLNQTCSDKKRELNSLLIRKNIKGLVDCNNGPFKFNRPMNGKTTAIN